MASNAIVKYIHDLPFQPRNQLCRILDADRRWEELGGNYMGYDITTLTLIGQSIQRDKSPTWELLNKYSERNGTIKRLFIMLTKMDHQRAMSVLQPFVEKKYHCLLRNESTCSTAFFNCASKEDIPKPSLSQLSITTSSLSSQSVVHHNNNTPHVSCHHHHHHHPSSTSKPISAICNTPHKEKGPYSTAHSKLNNNLANMNQSHSSVSLQSKLKSLNVPHVESKVIANKKSPDLSQFKKSTYSKEESVSDNCVSDKQKNSKKLSFQEMFLNGKMMKQHPHLPSGANYNSQDDSLPDFMRIPYSEICKATDNFNESRVLGKGGFGTVYKGEWKGTSVAIKRLTPKKSSDSSSQQLVSLKQSLNELNILKCCRFDHILPLYAVSMDGADPCLIYQLMVNGSLEDRLLCKNKTPPLTWLQRSHIAECTAKGLNYLHTIHTTYGKPLVHGDIKSANILLDSNMEAKIGDFGLTREGPGCDYTHVKVSSVHGTGCYLPPEYLRQRHLSPQVDIYSYGIVLLEIATGLRAYDLKREIKRLVEYVKAWDKSGLLDVLRDSKAGEENVVWFRELIGIGQGCSRTEKKKRPPMQDVLFKFERVKSDMSMMEKIRRLSNDKGNSLKQMKLSPEMNLSPIEIQLIYDLQKDGQSTAASENNKLVNISPGSATPAAAATSAIPLVIGQMKDISLSSKESKSNIESLDRRDSYVSSKSNSLSENDSSISAKLANRRSSTADKSAEKDPRIPPVPLLSLLNTPVSEFEGDVEGPSQNSLSSGNSDSN